MAARDLAIGLLLGGGGNISNRAIQAIIDNGKYLDEIVINNTYKLKLYAISTSTFRPPEHGVSGFMPGAINPIDDFKVPNPDFNGTDSDGTLRRAFFGRYTYYKIYYIAYENDEPFMAVTCYYRGESQNLNGGKTYTDVNTYTTKVLPYRLYYDDAETTTLTTTNLTLYNSTRTVWDGGIYDADVSGNNPATGTVEHKEIQYYIWTDSNQSEHARLDYTTTSTQTISFFSPQYPIYADLSYDDIVSKWDGLWRAANSIYYNKNFLDIQMEQPYDPPT
jgi:hypothetical protein